MTCTHLTTSDEAYTIDPLTNSQTAATIHLCSWPDAHPERFINAPRWVTRLIGPGLAINPARDCPGCPAFTTELQK